MRRVGKGLIGKEWKGEGRGKGRGGSRGNG